MRRLLALTALVPAQRGMRALSLMVLAWAGSIPLLQAQFVAPTFALDQGTQTASTYARPSLFHPFSAQSPLKFDVGHAVSRQWTGPILNSLQPQPKFDNFNVSAGMGWRTNGGAGFGAVGQGTGRFSPFGAAEGSGRIDSLDSFFQTGVNGAMSAVPDTQPSLYQLMRSPLIVPRRAFKLSYQDTLRPGWRMSDPGRGAASSAFMTSDLGNGMFLSAGTNQGSRFMAGAPAAPFGNGGAGAPKRSSPSVALKLSF